MKLSFILYVVLAAVLVAYAQQPMPRMSTVDPGNGKAGDVITVAGENLQKEHVAKVFLTDGKNDIPVEVVEAHQMCKAACRQSRFLASSVRRESRPPYLGLRFHCSRPAAQGVHS